MEKQLFSFLLLLSFVFSVSAQNKEARKIDEFAIIPCGDFMARMDSIFAELQNSPDSKIYVVYYGGRYRKENVWNKKIKNFNKLKLKYSHREDGLNWAKSIPIYLTTQTYYPTTTRNLLKDKIILINGGFQENTEVEIWIVPKDAESPIPTPTIAEKDIKFRKDLPSRTPNFTDCYGGL